MMFDIEFLRYEVDHKNNLIGIVKIEKKARAC